MIQVGRAILRWALILLAFLQPLLLDWTTRAAGQAPDASRVRLITLAFFVALLWLGLALTGGFAWRSHPLRWHLVGWALAIVAATLFSVAPDLSLFGLHSWHDGAVTLLLYVALLLALPAALGQQTISPRGLLGAWLGAALINGLVTELARRGIDPLALGTGSFMGNPDILAPYLVVPLVGSCAFLIWTFVGRWGQVLAGLNVVIWTWLLATTMVRGAWLGAAIVLGPLLLYLLIRGPRRGRTLVALALVVATVGLRLGVDPLFATRLHSVREESAASLQFGVQSSAAGAQGDAALLTDYSAVQRIWIWQGAWRVFLQRPLLGWGPDTLFLSFRHVQPPLGIMDPRMVQKAHNDYLEWLATHGIVGLGAYLAVLLGWMIMLVRRARSGTLAPWQAAVAVGLMASFAALTVEIANVRTMPSLMLLLGLTLAERKSGERTETAAA